MLCHMKGKVHWYFHSSHSKNPSKDPTIMKLGHSTTMGGIDEPCLGESRTMGLELIMVVVVVVVVAMTPCSRSLPMSVSVETRITYALLP